MTSNIIYHDFRNNDPAAIPQTASTVLLTASVLTKGRRLAAINHGLSVACITVCGLCLAVSIFVFGAIFGGM